MTVLITFIQKAIGQAVGMLFGATGEIITEKSGNLNLGIPGMMYMGGIAGLMGAFFYEKTAQNPNGLVGLLISFICAVLCAAFGGLIYSVLTITLRANQNVAGLALTTFGVILAILASWYLNKTRQGLNLRAVGESPATADAAGINVTRYKYLATCIGGGIAGLGGLYFVMEYLGGTWTNNGFGDRGWLAIALVIFALWKPVNAIWGSFLFGALYILYLYIPGLTRSSQEIFMLIITSFRKKRENQPPASLGESYFREER